MVTSPPKLPLQLRLNDTDLAMLDAYIARFPQYPPTRVTVLHQAVREWLSWQRNAVLHNEGTVSTVIPPSPTEDTWMMEGGSEPISQSDDMVARRRERQRRAAKMYRAKKKASKVVG